MRYTIAGALLLVCASSNVARAQAFADLKKAVKKVYSGPVSNGKPFLPGFMYGSEAVAPPVFGGGTTPASGWMNVIVSAQAEAKPADFNLAEGTMRYLVFTPPKPDYDYRTFISTAIMVCSMPGASLQTRTTPICRRSTDAEGSC